MGVLRAGALPGLHMQPTAQAINGSLKFEKSASNYLSRTFSAGNRKTFTVSFWHKHSNHSEGASVGAGGAKIFSTGTVGSGARGEFGFAGVSNGSNEDKVSIGFNATGSSWKSLTSDAFFRDFSAWQHFVIAVDCTLSEPNRVKFYCNGVEKTLSGSFPGNENQQFNNNVGHAIGRYNPEGTDYYSGLLSNFYQIDGLYLGPEYFGFTDPLTGTWRPKKFRAVGTTVNDGTDWSANFSGNGGTQPSTAFDGNGPRQDGYVHSGSALTVNFSPPLSGHIVVYGGTGAGSHNPTTTDTFTLSDGSVLTSQEKYDVAPYFSKLDFGEKKNITSLVCSGGYTLYAVSVDGVFLKDSTTQNLDFGTNGFYLPMDNEDDFEIDKSGKGNNWTKNGFSGTSVDPDVLKDSPSGAIFGGRAQTGITTTSSAPANYATLNPLNINDMGGTTSVTISDGNLTVANARNTYFGTALSTLSMTSGKYYCEATVDSNDATTLLCGILKIDPLESRWGTDDEQIGYFTNGYGYRSNNGNKENNLTNASYGDSYGNGDTIGIALDLDAKTISFYKNGTGQGVAYSGIPAGQYAFGFSSSETNNKWKANFGQKPFKYAPPQGFLPLNSATARPETVIARPEEYVGVTTWTGTAATHNITGFNFNAKPDFIWLKESSSSSSHGLWNSVVGQSKYLSSDLENDEESTTTEFSSFDYNGFTLGNNTMTNQSGEDYVAWGWKAGGDKNTFNIDDVGYASASAAGLDGGSVTPSGASVGTKQGFSIITWSRSSSTDSISHGLSQAPTFIIQKSRSADKRWQVGWEVEGWDRRLYLNLTDADSDSSSFGYTGNFGPTNTLIRTGGTSYVDGDMIAYCWHDVPGLQKFGKFSGNGAADGVFVELGFRPAILLIKNDNSTGDWIIWDNKRNKFNPVNRQIWPYTTSGTYGAYDQVGSNYPLDFLSNGFKMRTTDADMNSSSRTYLYAAWAEQPVSNLFGGQSTGR